MLPNSPATSTGTLVYNDGNPAGSGPTTTPTKTAACSPLGQSSMHIFRSSMNTSQVQHNNTGHLHMGGSISMPAAGCVTACSPPMRRNEVDWKVQTSKPSGGVGW